MSNVVYQLLHISESHAMSNISIITYGKLGLEWLPFWDLSCSLICIIVLWTLMKWRQENPNLIQVKICDFDWFFGKIVWNIVWNLHMKKQMSVSLRKLGYLSHLPYYLADTINQCFSIDMLPFLTSIYDDICVWWWWYHRSC